MKNLTIFNRVKKHLLTQGKKAKRKGECRYRAGELSCAVGCLIKDEHYDKSLEGRNVTSLPVRRALVKSLRVKRLSKGVLELLSELQTIHDESNTEDWPRHLEETKRSNAKLLARSFGTRR